MGSEDREIGASLGGTSEDNLWPAGKVMLPWVSCRALPSQQQVQVPPPHRWALPESPRPVLSDRIGLTHCLLAAQQGGIALSLSKAPLRLPRSLEGGRLREGDLLP